MASDYTSNKVALLLLSMGEEDAVAIMQQLSDSEMLRVAHAMTKLRAVEPEEMQAVIEQFHQSALDYQILGGSPAALVESIVGRTLGPQGIEVILSLKEGNDLETKGIESLKWMDPQTITDLLRTEHPQIIATTLIHLQSDLSAKVLTLLGSALRAEVVARIATVEGVSPLALQELNEVLKNFQSSGQALNKRKTGGVSLAAEIVNHLDVDVEDDLLQTLKSADEPLAQKILDEMYTFDHIVDLDDAGIQRLLQEIVPSSLLLALKGSSEAVRNKFLQNMSGRAGQMLLSELQEMGPVKRIEVDRTRKEIMNLVKKLASEGKIELRTKDVGDQYVF